MASRRRKSRTMALQALYQWQLSGSNLSQIEAEFYADNDMTKADGSYFRELLKEIPGSVVVIDAEFAPYLSRPIETLDPIEKALLRIGTYELKHRIDVPYRVVINEAVSLAKKFGGTDGHKFVNGILDRLASRLRKDETPKR
ncbi:MAG: transcription antitermination factor NusB [Gammaproteobacteria bacterium]|nr:MAG: transcription antitermination factor NusB [Gammaproteobacteria bacterium]